MNGSVRTSQVGYRPEERKIAAVCGEAKGGAVIWHLPNRQVALVCHPGEDQHDEHSGDTVRLLDFSELRVPGEYSIDVPGVGESYPFRIGEDVYARPLRLAMRMFTGQRCGMVISLAPDFPQYQYPACHTVPVAFHPSSGKQGECDCSGGWHDAGDYGRYIVNSGITTGTLLLAYELNREKLRGLQLDLPESGGRVPDFLAEVAWNIRWMLKMQDGDGGVWHKATSASFPGFIMPQDDPLPALVIGSGEAPYKTTEATADFVAVTAMAARTYRACDPQFAEQCLTAALRGWQWLATTPDHHFVHNPEGIRTGGYGDKHAADERLWAAAELFRTTGEAQFDSYFQNHYGQWQPAIAHDKPQAWPDVHNLGMFAYAFAREQGADSAVCQRIVEDAVAAADQIVERSQKHPYRIPMLGTDYIWGSNAVVANYAMLLQLVNRLRPRREYQQTALDVLHYLFGRNTFATSFVTQVGCHYAMNPHHRPSGADGIAEPWPGMLVGGPNWRATNPAGTDPPARQWFDEQGSYQTNEIAINWNAPLVFVLAEVF